jgi:chromosome segregation ATPase
VERREQAYSSHAAAVATADAQASAHQECERLRAAVRAADQRASQAEARLAAQATEAARSAHDQHEDEYAKQRAHLRAMEEAHRKEVVDLKASLASATSSNTHPHNDETQATVQDLTDQLEAAERIAAAASAKSNSLQERLEEALASLEAVNDKANVSRTHMATNTIPTDEVAELRSELETVRSERAQETASAQQKMKALEAQLERELNKGSARAQVQLLTDLERCQQERESDRVSASIEIARLESKLAGERALRDAGLKAAANELRELKQQHQELLEQFSPEQVQQFQASRDKSSTSGNFDSGGSGHNNNNSSTGVHPGASGDDGDASVETLSSLVDNLRSDLARERQRRTELIAAHEARVEQLSKDLAFAVKDVTAVRNAHRDEEEAASAQVTLLKSDLEQERQARLMAESTQSEQVGSCFCRATNVLLAFFLRLGHTLAFFSKTLTYLHISRAQFFNLAAIQIPQFVVVSLRHFSIYFFF